MVEQGSTERRPAWVEGPPLVLDARDPATLADVLQRAAQRAPDRGVIFVDEQGGEEFVSYPALLAAARRGIAALRAAGVEAGDKLILLPRNSREFVELFWSCFLGGVVPVPLPGVVAASGSVAPSEQLSLELRRVLGVWEQLQRPAIVAPESFLTYRELLAAEARSTRIDIYSPRALAAQCAKDATPEPPVALRGAQDTALLLYSSGSTSDPKGVVLTHRNLIFGLKATAVHNGFGAADATLCWAPLYHVIGLTCFHLLPIYTGANQVLIEPYAFVKRPELWFEKIDRHRVAFTGGPNFAYTLARTRVSEARLAEWDLSCLKVLLNGGEVVSVDAMEAFYETFRRSGLRAEALAPAYGMSETAGGIAYPRPDEPLGVLALERRHFATTREVRLSAEGSSDTVRFAMLGHPLPGLSLRIVDDADRLLAERQVGHIQVRGPMTTDAYYGDPAATSAAFVDGWLRTGDLGLIDAGQLTIVGRAKDVIIVHGHNYYAHDLEQLAQSVAGVVPGRVVVIGSYDHRHERERVVLFAAIDATDPEHVVREIELKIKATAGLTLDDVVQLAADAFPRTPSGKIQRGKLKQLWESGHFEATPFSRPEPAPTVAADFFPRAQCSIGQAANISAEEQPSGSRVEQVRSLERFLRALVAWHLGVAPEALDVESSLAELGLDSLVEVQLARELEDRLGATLSATLAFEFPSIAALARHLAEIVPADRIQRLGAGGGSEAAVGVFGHAAASSGAVTPEEREPSRGLAPTRTRSAGAGGPEIAIVGLAARFPGADSIDRFWHNLRDGVDSVREAPADRWPVAEFYAADPEAPGKTVSKWGGFLDSVDRFDARFFGISPHEAQRMDPQQRLLLEVAWEALEHAGLAGQRVAGTNAGVFVGVSVSDYLRRVLSDAHAVDAFAASGNFLSIIANRLSYFLDLKGPSLAVDTACSSSLVALHLAVQSLRGGECQSALVAGVHVLLSPELWINFSKAGMLADDGRAKPFDDRANGYVRGEGVGVVVLKPLANALADRDTVYGVVRATAVNQDGRTNGLTAPSSASQAEVLRRAYEQAGIDPATIGYLEAHGTGTSLGDPIELEALTRVFSGRAAGQSCAVGSVKGNIGHLEPAAGMAGLIKALLAIRHRQIPPSLHFEVPNRLIRFEQTPFYVADRLRAWVGSKGARCRAGVSAFGFGGTNAHVVLEEAPAEKPVANVPQRPRQLFVLSARSRTVVETLAGSYAQHLRAKPDLALADVCHTAATGRAHFGVRLALSVRSVDELAEQLAAFSRGDASRVNCDEVSSGKHSRVALLFTGQGAQYTGMGQELFQTAPVFRQALDRCAAVLRDELDVPLVDLLFGGSDRSLDDTRYAQPALFALEYALFELWRSFGLRAEAVAGHSLGEYTAAAVAGVLPLDDALRLVARRARWMQALPRTGAMVAVLASEAEVAPVLQGYTGRVTIAALNGPRNTVLSGERAALAEIVEALGRRGIDTQELAVSHAFHSACVEPMVEAFAGELAKLHFQAPRLKLVSNVTGQFFAPGEAPTADYWLTHLRQTVRFAETIHSLAAADFDVLIELGPGATLVNLARQTLSPRTSEPGASAPGFPLLLPSLSRGMSDWQTLLESLGRAYAHGLEIDWEGVDRDYAGHRVALPTYPFERQRYWFEPSRCATPPVEAWQRSVLLPASAHGNPAPVSESDAQAGPPLDGWFHEVSWEDEPSTGRRPLPQGSWLLVGRRQALSEVLAERLGDMGVRAIVAESGARFQRHAPRRFALDLASTGDHVRLLETVFAEAPDLQGIVFVSPSRNQTPDEAGSDELARGEAFPVETLFRLSQALSRYSARPLELWVVTADAQAIGGTSVRVSTADAAVCGLTRVIAREFPQWRVQLVDLPSATQEPRLLAAQLCDELTREGDSGEIVLCGDRRLAPRLKVAPWDAAAGQMRIRSDGVYVITGGLGGLGLQVARYFAEQAQPRLVLVGRSVLPPEAEWPSRLVDVPDPIAAKLRGIVELRALGAEVWPVSADVCDRRAMEQLLDDVRRRFGAVHGVVHAAGTLRDRMLRHQSSDDFRAVLGPKIAGALVLDRLTQGDELDFFVLFSSLSPLLGTVGQGAYSAANAWLDALAADRQMRRHLPSLSLAWSAWSEVGMAAAALDVEALAATGLRAIDPALGRRLFGSALGRRGSYYALLQRAAQADRKPIAPFIRRVGTLTAVESPSRDTGRAPQHTRPATPAPAAAAARFETDLAEQLAAVLGLPAHEIKPDINFMELGLNSILATKASRRFVKDYDLPLEPVWFFTYPTLRLLAAHLAAISTTQKPHVQGTRATAPDRTLLPVPQRGAETRPAEPPSLSAPARDVAVIGFSCRLPGASNPEEFWRNLRAGVDAVGEPPDDRRGLAGSEDDHETGGPLLGGFLADVAGFDAAFFGLSPREARLMDPQQRLFLEVVWEAIERAGYQPDLWAGRRAGLFVGASASDYVRLWDRSGESLDPHFASGTSMAMIANRVSYLLNLTGPSMTLDTACSSSLVALHEACRSLADGECELAIAGGVNLTLLAQNTRVLQRAGMLAADGRSKTFDDRADGYVRGEGVVAVVLKPLAAAIADGDQVWAVVKSTAVNHDGHVKAGLTAPSVEAQTALLRAAYHSAAIDPRSLGFVETHGTGTSLGDPIEVLALRTAWGDPPAPHGACALGSVKTNIGHLEAAAGLAGFLKVVLAIHHGQLPATLHCRIPNRRVDWEASPFYINDRLRPWPHGAPRRAGVSSFGFGGTNAHAVVEAAPAKSRSENLPLTLPSPARGEGSRTGSNSPTAAPQRPARVLTLSARSETALRQFVERYRSYLNQPAAADLADICFTANTGRKAFEYRLAIVARFRDQLSDRLRLLKDWDDRAQMQGSLIFSGGPGTNSPAETFEGLRPRLAELTSAALSVLASIAHGRWFDLECRPWIENALSAEVAFDARLDGEAWTNLLAVLAELYTLGVEIDWGALDRGAGGRRVLLPTYPFERERYWLQSRVTKEIDTPRSREPARSQADSQGTRAADVVSQTLRQLVGLVARALEVDPAKIDPRRPVVELGVDSVLATRLARELNRTARRRDAGSVAAGQPGPLPASLFYEYSTLERLARALVEDLGLSLVEDMANRGSSQTSEARSPRESGTDRNEPVGGLATLSSPTGQPLLKRAGHEPIAVIGMGGRFPGAPTLAQFWDLLRMGRDAVRSVAAGRCDPAGERSRAPTDSTPSPPWWGALLDGIDQFDASFFRLSRREAEEMDPQQRLFLEVAWESLEDAGYAGERLRGSRTGVFVGAMASEYVQNLLSRPEQIETHAATGNAMSMIANRVSYFLNLQGPSLAIDTACSSSLVAIHLAVESLRRGECDTAIVGGTQAALAPSHFQLMNRLRALSPSGRCQSFAEGADGYVLGEGIGAVLLKPLGRALAERDYIHGVILGTAIGHGGEAAGLTVPTAAQQAGVIRAALANAGVAADSLTLLEAHGTGTALGDPIEIEGLVRAFAPDTGRTQFCAIGSVKSNIGHLEPAAGIAALLKVLLAMRYGQLPPTIHLPQPNRALAFEQTPFYLVDRLQAWSTAEDVPRRAGISSFGFGGTNAHIIVEEALRGSPSTAVEPQPIILAISARSTTALVALARRFAALLDEHPAQRLVDICYTAATGRAELAQRLAIVAQDREALRRGLLGFLESAALHRPCPAGVFVGASAGNAADRGNRTQLAEILSDVPAHLQEAVSSYCRSLIDSDPQGIQRTAEVTSQAGGLGRDWPQLAPLVARLFAAGVGLEWESLYAPLEPRRVPLPTYPFERQRYWIAPGEERAGRRPDDAPEQQPDGVAVSAAGAHSYTAATAVAQRRDEDLAPWIHQVVWREAPVGARRALPSGTWLVLADNCGLAAELVRHYAGASHRFVVVTPGANFGRLDADRATLNPSDVGDFRCLASALREAQPPLVGAIHLWNCQPLGKADEPVASLQRQLDAGLASSLFLLQAFATTTELPLEFWLVTADAQPVDASNAHLNPAAAAVWGLARAAAKELRRARVRIVDVPLGDATPRECTAWLRSELEAARPADQVAYRAGRRYTPGIVPRDPLHWPTAPAPRRERGVYLITGGCGAMGLVLARELASHGNATLILVNRTPLPPDEVWPAWLQTHPASDEIATRIRGVQTLRSFGTEVWPVACDVSDPRAMTDLVAEIRRRYGCLHGIVHAAGVLRDRLLVNTTADDLAAVLAPKAIGAWVLEEATRGEPLDFVVLVSSLASLAGNVGQAAYGAANACLDTLAAAWARRCPATRVVALDFGPWAESGMAAGDDPARWADVGLAPVPPEIGRRLFDFALSQSATQWALFAWTPAAAARRRAMASAAGTDEPDFTPLGLINLAGASEASGRMGATARSTAALSTIGPSTSPRWDLEPRAIEALRAIVADVLRLRTSEVNTSLPFRDHGVDSLLAEDIVRRLRRQWSLAWLSVAALFEHPTIEALARFLCDHDRPALKQALAPSREASVLPTASGRSPAGPERVVDTAVPAPRFLAAGQATDDMHDIAIVGYACRFPGAEGADSFWELLAAGRSAVGPMPPARWQIAQSYDPDIARHFGGQPPRGGFLNAVDCFDAAFFRLSAAEARQIDPRQRLFLEAAYAAAEHAGYGGRRLARTRTGVFVGTGAEDYFTGLPADALGEHSAIGGTAATLPSRLAYFLDLTGPALAVDTACSGALVAVHLAVESLRRGECEFAFAGAVHLHLRLMTYAALARMGALSPDGRCRAFDNQADGFVPAEGVGVLVLRPLAAALAAGDTVHGIIKGTAVNNDGRTNGLTAPNPAAQAQLLAAAWRDARIDPATLTYVEAHGTGTGLGDPIEVQGLVDALGRFTDRRQFCAIGSVKSNLGHADSAAGMAGLIKVLLAFKHRQLPASLHIESPNGRVHWTETPLVLADRLQPWETAGAPRRAGVSAFGFSGTNAHVVLEEAAGQPELAVPEDRPLHLLTLSALDDDSLRRLAKAYRRALEQPDGQAALADICYTANTGRFPLRRRLAIVAPGREQLCEQLDRLLATSDWRSVRSPDVFVVDDGDASQATGLLESTVLPCTSRLSPASRAALFAWCRGPLVEQQLAPMLEAAASDRAATPALHDVAEWTDLLRALAALYVLGTEIDWEAFDAPYHRRRVPVPTYPYRQKSYWHSPLPFARSAERDGVDALEPGTHVLAAPGVPRAPHTDWTTRVDCYEPVWQIAPLATDRHEPTGEAWLVFADSRGLAAKLVEQARGRGVHTVVVDAAARFADRGPSRFTIDAVQGDDYARLFAALESRGWRPTAIWHFWGVGRSSAPIDENPAASLECGVLSLFELAKAVQRARQAEQVALRVVTAGSQAVHDPRECTAPAGAASWGLLRALAREAPQLYCQAIDVLLSDEPLERIAGRLLDEATGKARDAEIAYRGAQRLVLRRCPVDAAPAPSRSALRQAGVYLITGGLGGIGLALAQRLVERYAARLVLVGRSPLPARETWGDVLWTSDPAGSLARKIHRLRRIESLGGEFLALGADVTDLAAVQAVVATARERFGRIDGVFHAAGIIRKGLLKEEARADFAAVLGPKIAGASVLTRALSRERLDFMCFFSSIAGFDGNIFQADYSAANRALDSFAAYARTQGIAARAIHWGLWSEVGMGLGLAEVAQLRGDAGLATSDALDALEWTLARDDRSLIVLPHATAGVSIVAEFAPTTGTPRQPRLASSLAVAELAPQRTAQQAAWLDRASRQRALENAIRGLLAETLGEEPRAFDPQTSFLDLGVDSLLAARFARLLASRSRQPCSPTLLFDYPHLAALVEHLDRALDAEDLACWLLDVDAAGGDDATGNGHKEAGHVAQENRILRLQTGRRVTPVAPGSR